MTPLIFMFCLAAQGADSTGQGIPKAVEGEETRRHEGVLQMEGLNALLNKVNALEAEIKELKKAPASAQDKEKSSGAEAQSDEEKKKKQMEEEFKKALGEQKPEPPPSQGIPLGAAGTLKLLDIAFDILATGGSSTATEDEIRLLEAGGHDPKNRGFTIQNVELTFAGVVDPYLRGDANIVLQIDSNGDTTIELEEAYLTTLDFPFNLQLKAGQYFSQFGRLNASHPHTWDFVDQPVINSRLLGEDGFRGPGAQLAWLTPLPFFAELTGSVQNSQGGTAASFRGVPGEMLAGRPLVSRPVRSLGDLAYVLRLKTSFDPSEEVTIVPGVSALFGPNATGPATTTQIFGTDFYLKWKPLANDTGWPFVAWQTELMIRRYQAAAAFNTILVQIDPQRTLDDWGAYSQIVWGFARPWVMGFRLDYARGQEDTFSDGSYSSSTDPLRDRRERASIDLTYYPSEFSKVRLQYNYDRSEFLSRPPFSGMPDAHSVWMQFEILFGAHAAHKF